MNSSKEQKNRCLKDLKTDRRIKSIFSNPFVQVDILNRFQRQNQPVLGNVQILRDILPLLCFLLHQPLNCHVSCLTYSNDKTQQTIFDLSFINQAAPAKISRGFSISMINDNGIHCKALFALKIHYNCDHIRLLKTQPYTRKYLLNLLMKQTYSLIFF